MKTWVVAGDQSPYEPGWYPTLSDWGTATLHPGAHRWLGAKWATSCPERIELYFSDPFDDPHDASSRAFALEIGGAERAAQPDSLSLREPPPFEEAA